MTPCTAGGATALLIFHNAPERLLRHNELVLEAAELLMKGYREIGCWSQADGTPRETPFLDEEKVRIGVVFHDAGKIEHPEELDGDGSLHELGGSQMLMRWGVSSDLTGFCYAYSWWESCEALSLEHYTVALADKLWRGARDPEFEEDAIREITYAATGQHKAVDWWSALDLIFERIADGGHERLERSRT